MRLARLAALAPAVALCQQPVAPLASPGAHSREAGGYQVSNALEAGYRFAEVGGSRDLYRAGPNYGDGLRIFNARFRATSLDRSARIDRVSLRSTGGPGDPYQVHAVGVEADGLFRYGMQARLVSYHNRLPALWSGEHGIRSSRALQSHDLTAFPGSRFEVLLGWDRNRRTGPGFASSSAAPADGNFDDRNFLRYRQDIDQRSSAYRAGFTARFAGLALTFVRSVDLYRERAAFQDASGLPSLAPNVQPVGAVERSHPHHGRSPTSSVALRTRGNGRLGFDARYVYSSGYRGSRLFEGISAAGSAAGSPAAYRELFVVGDAGRRHGSGDFTATFLASPRLTVTNVTSFHNMRMDGQAAVVEMIYFLDEYVRLDRLAIRRLSNATEVTYRPLRPVAVFGAYRTSDRRAQASDAIRYPDFGFGRELQGQDNRMRSGLAGVRWLPANGLRASLDLEVGRADRPIAATSERRFGGQSARLRWTRGLFSASGFFRRRANANPADLLEYRSTSRSHGFQASWASPDSATVLDGSYTVLAMDVTAGVLNLFQIPGGPGRLESSYAANIHVASAGAHMTVGRRLGVAARYSLTKDTAGGAEGFRLDGPLLITGFPVSYHSPQVRVSARIAPNWSWNLGWQYYGYAERFAGTRGYRAHVCFSSVTVGF